MTQIKSSEVINTPALRDAVPYPGRPWSEAVIYELHVGTFSDEGTYAGVENRLDYLRDLGITAIQLMPINDVPGRHNWGYDGVLLYAPNACYGRPEDLKRLLRAAHQRDMKVYLDVVYNHCSIICTAMPRLFLPIDTRPAGVSIGVQI